MPTIAAPVEVVDDDATANPPAPVAIVVAVREAAMLPAAAAPVEVEDELVAAANPPAPVAKDVAVRAAASDPAPTVDPAVVEVAVDTAAKPPTPVAKDVAVRATARDPTVDPAVVEETVDAVVAATVEAKVVAVRAAARDPAPTVDPAVVEEAVAAAEVAATLEARVVPVVPEVDTAAIPPVASVVAVRAAAIVVPVAAAVFIPVELFLADSAKKKGLLSSSAGFFTLRIKEGGSWRVVVVARFGYLDVGIKALDNFITTRSNTAAIRTTFKEAAEGILLLPGKRNKSWVPGSSMCKIEIL